MHSQEPWQSRSPTGSVNKPLISSTLKKTGRRGPNHSYGRGLPVKRKALIILSIAILAFAMIPAIGAGAATAAVKIVTPHELANPSDDDDSAFDNLAGSTVVSDVTGREDMADTYGTLYAVVEDNDNASNTLTTYTAYFATAGTDASVTFDVAGAAATVHKARHTRVQPGADADSLVSDDDRADLEIADREKDGGVGAEDVTVYLAVGTDAAATTTRLPQDFIIDAVGSNVFLNLSTRGTGVDAVRIEFTTASADSSTVLIKSAAGDEITIDVTEKNLAFYEGTDDDGVTADEFANDDSNSVDSGIFVGSFGVIPNVWKKMINNWATDDEGDDATISSASPAADIDPVATPVVITDPDDSTESNGPDIRALLVDVGAGNFIVDANGDRKIDHTDIEADFQALTGSTHAGGNAELVAITPTTGVTVTLTSLSARGTAATETITCPLPAGSAQAAQTADPSATQRVACVEIHVPDGGTTLTEANFVTGPPTTEGDPATTPTEAAFDKVEFTFETESNVGALLTQLDEDTDPRHDAFQDLADDDDAREDLDEALRAQLRNLGIADDDTAAASAITGRLLGVENLGSIEVLYSDPSPKSTRRATASVDLAGPTVGGLTPAKGSFTTRDSFDMLFTVTDSGAGIPEDAEDPGENTVGNTDTALVDVAVSVSTGASLDPGDDDPDVNETRETIGDGYQYELDVRINRDTGNLENITVTVTITAYDLVGNRTVSVVTYIVDTKDPILLGALTGVGAKLDTQLERDTKNPPTLGAYELVLNDPTWLTLVFDDAINGANLGPPEIVVAGKVVESVLWLDGSGANVITTEALSDTSVTADNGNGLNLDSTGRGQNARHILFVKMAAALDTSDRPAIEIDGDDLEDLAGNEDVSDHTLARAHDRLGPKLTVTVNSPLSKDTLDVTVTSSEELRRPPTAGITAPAANVRDLTVKSTAANEWSIQANARTIGQTNGGVRTISVSGEDENGNGGTKTAKWELDVEANAGDPPVRLGTTNTAKAHSIETNPVTFLNLDFSAETGEYTGDSKKKINLTELSLETLDAASIKANGDIATPASAITVTDTAAVDAASAQTSDNIKHVIALTELAIGNYRLQVSYADEAGNTGKYGYFFRITAPAPAEIAVVPGWSLVSIPGTPQDTSISGVFEGSSVTHVWSLNNLPSGEKEWQYAQKDADSGEWMGTLAQIVDGRAYFVRSTTFDPISVLTTRFDPRRTPPQYTVTRGWNTIGYTPAGSENAISVDGYLSALGASGWGMIRMWNTDATPPQYETYFSSGAMTDGFSTGDGPDGDGVGDNPSGTDGDSVANGAAKVERGKGYLLFATRNGIIGG